MTTEEREKKRELTRKRKMDRIKVEEITSLWKMEAISNLLENSQLQIKRRERDRKLAEKRSRDALLVKDVFDCFGKPFFDWSRETIY